jgi:glucokinase
MIAEAAAAGDALAESAIMESARTLGIASVSVMHLLNPEMILLGGAMTFGRHSQPLGRAFLERVKQEIRERAFPIPAERTIIDYAALGGDAGFIGAAGYARQRCGAAVQTW